MEKILNEKQRSEMEQYLETQGVKEAYAVVTSKLNSIPNLLGGVQLNKMEDKNGNIL